MPCCLSSCASADPASVTDVLQQRHRGLDLHVAQWIPILLRIYWLLFEQQQWRQQQRQW